MWDLFKTICGVYISIFLVILLLPKLPHLTRFLLLGLIASLFYGKMIHPYFAGYRLGFGLYRKSYNFKMAMKISWIINNADFVRSYLDERRNFTLSEEPEDLNRYITMLNDDSDVEVRVYGKKEEDRISLIYFHGGGWSINNLNSYAHVLRRFAERGDVVVYGIDYRKAPENPIPEGFNDCLDFVKWVAENAEKYGSNGEKIVVAGDSAGGQLSMATTLYLRDNDPEMYKRIVGNILIYGSYFYAPSNASRYKPYTSKETGKYGYIIDLEVLNIAWNWYAGNYKNLEDHPYMSPSSAMKDVTNYPPSLFIQAGKGILLEEGLEMVKKLRDNKNDVEVDVSEDAIHGFFGYPGCGGDKYFDDVVSPWLKKKGFN